MTREIEATITIHMTVLVEGEEDWTDEDFQDEAHDKVKEFINYGMDHDELDSFELQNAVDAGEIKDVDIEVEAGPTQVRRIAQAYADKANQLEGRNAKLAEALQHAVDVYGQPGGPWNVPSDPGGWISKARAALAKRECKDA